MKKGTSSSNSSVFYIFIILLLAVIVAFLLFQKFTEHSGGQQTAQENRSELSAEEHPEIGESLSSAENNETGRAESENTVSAPLFPGLTKSGEAAEQVPNTQLQTGADHTLPDSDRLESSGTPALTGPLTGGRHSAETAFSERSCSDSCKQLALFYAYLDRQEYIAAYNLSPSSEIYFSEIIQELADNSPVINGEMDDLFTILQNTAHLFRVIGKQNIALSKSVLIKENDRIEDLLKGYYTVLLNPDCQKRMHLNISDKALFGYSAFFLNSMGGRLYLFRRDVRSRMLVSYYAILFIDRANSQGENDTGIDIKPHIASLIDEIESSGSTLQYRDNYLNRLYLLEEKYE